MEASPAGLIATPPPQDYSPAQRFALWWEGQPPNARILWSLVAATALATLVFLSVRINQPEYVAMYSGLASDDATAIGSVLTERGIPFKMSEKGDAVLVPTSQRDQARLLVAGEGVLPSGPAGYEILDNSNPWSLTDFNQRINLQRAREGELARTLMTLQGVSQARVMLSIPDDSPFLSETKEPGASVALSLKGGKRSLGAEEAQTIANLVAASVPELDPDNVVIVDQYAHLLAGPGARSGLSDDTADGEGIVTAFEHRLEDKVRTLLEAAYGASNVRVSVTAALDLDKVSQTKETFMPDPATGQGIKRSEETREGSSTGGAPIDEGVPGTTSNIPSYPTAPEAGGSGNSKFSTTVTNYEISKTLENIDKAPGAVSKQSISVLLDQPSALDATTQTQLETMIQGAINYDETRGDTVVVAALPFSTEIEDQLKTEMNSAQQAEWWDRGIQVGGWLIVIALLFWGTSQLLRVLSQPWGVAQSAYAGGGMFGGGGGGMRMMGGGGSGGGSGEQAELPPLSREVSVEEQARQRIRNEVLEIARTHPDEAARVIRNWLRD